MRLLRSRLLMYSGMASLLLALSTLVAIAEPLPQPLTLDHALSLSSTSDPLLQQQEAIHRRSLADRALIESEQGVDLRLKARLRWVGPSATAPDPGPDDHQIGLLATKQLYDFGRNKARVSAAGAESRSAHWLYLRAAEQRRITIMARYFDVILADMTYARDTEAMSVAYIAKDKLSNRYELGQASDLDLAKTEAAYQLSRHRQAVSSSRQRASRSLLAMAINRPTELPPEVSRPVLASLTRQLPEYEPLLERGIANNPLVLARRESVLAAEQRVAAARARRGPVIAGEMAASEYSRDKGSNDQWLAGLNMELPLYNGGAVSAAVARQQALYFQAQGQLQEAEQSVRQAILDEWLELTDLRVKLDQVRSGEDYRALYLDRSRANYEMEVQTDLGDAMVQLSNAELERLSTEFGIALAWARLDALLGEEVSP